MVPEALADDSASVQDLDRVADSQTGRDVARETPKRTPLSQGADDDVSPEDRRHAPIRELQLPVHAFLPESPDHDGVPGGDLDPVRDLDVLLETEPVDDRCDLVNPDDHSAT